MLEKLLQLLFKGIQYLAKSKLYLLMYYKIFDMSVAVWGEPDFAEVIIFNERPTNCDAYHKERCPTKYCQVCRVQTIVRYIDNAKYSLDLAQLTFSSKVMMSAVMRAHRRGVRIRLITDSHMIHSMGSVVVQLALAGIPVRLSEDGAIMHNKLSIIDGTNRIKQLNRTECMNYNLWLSRGLVVTGSLNWTKQGFSGNYENAVVFSNRTLLAEYEQVFNSMWNKFQDLKADAYV